MYLNAELEKYKLIVDIMTQKITYCIRLSQLQHISYWWQHLTRIEQFRRVQHKSNNDLLGKFLVENSIEIAKYDYLEIES